MITINDQNWQEHYRPSIDGVKVRGGGVARNYETHPLGCYANIQAFDMPLIPENEWEERLADQKAKNKRYTAVRRKGKFGQMMPSRDQNGKGYCWAHSSVSALLLLRAMFNLPYVDLSAYAVACIIKNYRDQGGWCSQSVEWIAENGCPSSEFWPQQSMKRENDTPDMRANAKLHRYLKWVELDPGNLNQLVTMLLQPIPVPVITDFNWWSHSVCTMQIESIKPLRTRIWNSWGDSWSEQGEGILEDRKCIPDGAIAPLLSTLS